MTINKAKFMWNLRMMEADAVGKARGRTQVHCDTAGCGRQSGGRKTEKLDR